MLKASIEFYRADGRTAFQPQPDPALKTEVARWLLTPEGQAYATEVDISPPVAFGEPICPATMDVNSAALELSSLQTVIQADVREEAKDVIFDEGEHREGRDQLIPAVAYEQADAPADRLVDDTDAASSSSSRADVNISIDALPGTTSQLKLHDPHLDGECSQILDPSPTATTDSLPSSRPVDHAEDMRLEVEALRAELERVKQHVKTAPRLSSSTTMGARRRPLVRSIQPAVERAALMTELRRAPMVEVATGFLNDNIITYVMEVLNHHNHLLHHRDQHAYCFDPQVVARAGASDSYGLRTLDAAAADAARFWLLPRNTTRCHWWLDVYDHFRHILYRADSLSTTQAGMATAELPPLNVWPDDPPEVRHLTVPQQEDGVSCGDHVIQFALAIATPGWFPDSNILSRVLPWDRGQELCQLRAGRWEVQRPQPRLAAESSGESVCLDQRQLSEKPLRRSNRKRGWVGSWDEIDRVAGTGTGSDSECSSAASDLVNPSTPASKCARPSGALELPDQSEGPRLCGGTGQPADG